MSLESELNDLEPRLREKIAAIINDCPYAVSITSSWRSPAEQKRLYDGWKARKPGFNPANPPGRSKHEKVSAKGKPAAEACDLNYESAVAVNWVHKYAANYGIHFPIRKENWHAESNGENLYRATKPATVAPNTTEQDDDMTEEDRKMLTEVHKMLTQLTAPRKADKSDIDPKRLSLADIYTLVEKS